MERPIVYCADVGSVKKGNFSWARWGDRTQPVKTSPDIEVLPKAVASDLKASRAVALGFECPLFVPMHKASRDLLNCRPGERNRAWSANAGTCSMAAGLVESVWILELIRQLCGDSIPVFLQPEDFQRQRCGLLLWEAFVSNKETLTLHADDASLAVRTFDHYWPKLKEADELPCPGLRVLSLIGTALLRTGWGKDLTFISAKPVVIRAPRSEVVDVCQNGAHRHFPK